MLSSLKNVTANDLETSYILFFHNFAIYKERFDFECKVKSNFWKTTFYAVILQNIKISLCKGKRVVTNSNFHVTSF